MLKELQQGSEVILSDGSKVRLAGHVMYDDGTPEPKAEEVVEETAEKEDKPKAKHKKIVS